jgi:hypothetical protein
MIHWFSCDTNLAPVGRESPPQKKNRTKELGNANHAYKGSNNNKKKSLNQSIQNYNQSTEQRTQDTQVYIQ